MTGRTAVHEAATTLCPRHGRPLATGEAEAHRASCVEREPSHVAIAEEHFPAAASVIWGPDVSGQVPVVYCPVCRDAEAAWTAASGTWSAKHLWARAGWDPYHGIPVTTVAATLVDDYVWVEKWNRAMNLLAGPFVLPYAQYGSLEGIIRVRVAQARTDGAPLTATWHDPRNGWQTIDTLDDCNGVRTLVGLPPLGRGR